MIFSLLLSKNNRKLLLSLYILGIIPYSLQAMEQHEEDQYNSLAVRLIEAEKSHNQHEYSNCFNLLVSEIADQKSHDQIVFYGQLLNVCINNNRAVTFLCNRIAQAVSENEEHNEQDLATVIPIVDILIKHQHLDGLATLIYLFADKDQNMYDRMNKTLQEILHKNHALPSEKVPTKYDAPFVPKSTTIQIIDTLADMLHERIDTAVVPDSAKMNALIQLHYFIALKYWMQPTNILQISRNKRVRRYECIINNEFTPEFPLCGSFFAPAYRKVLATNPKIETLITTIAHKIGAVVTHQNIQAINASLSKLPENISVRIKTKMRNDYWSSHKIPYIKNTKESPDYLGQYKQIKDVEGYKKPLDENTILIWNRTCFSLWNISSDQHIQTFTPHMPQWPIVRINANTLASCSEKNNDPSRCFIRIWDIRSGKIIKILKGHQDKVTSVASLNENILATGSDDKTIKLWKVSSGECIKTLTEHKKEVTSLIRLNNDTFASCSEDKTIKIWDFSGNCIKTLSDDTYFGVFKLVRIDDNTFASISNTEVKDPIIKLWNLPLGECIKTLKITEKIPISEKKNPILFYIDKGLASGSWDKITKLWELPSFDEILLLLANKHEGNQVTKFFSSFLKKQK